MAALLVACSDDSFVPEPLDDSAEPSQDVVDSGAPDSVIDPSTTELDIDPDALRDGPVSAEIAAQVTTWFNEFLDTRDRYLLGKATLDEVARYTSDRVLLAQLPELQSVYLELLSLQNIVATKEFASFTNPENMTATRGRIIFDDCTEVQSLSVLDIVGFKWVDQQITVAEDGTGWSIILVDVLHDGEPFTSGLGCAPESFRTRAAAVTQAVMEEFRGYQQDPTTFGDDSFDEFDDRAVRDVFAGAVEQQLSEGISVVSPEELRYTPVGLNVPGSLLGWAVVVDVCSYRPEGLLYQLDGSDEIIEDTTIEPGFSLGYRVTTLLDQVSEDISATDQILLVEVTGEDCW